MEFLIEVVKKLSDNSEEIIESIYTLDIDFFIDMMIYTCARFKKLKKPTKEIIGKRFILKFQIEEK